MRVLQRTAILLLAGPLAAWAESNVVIKSFELPGRIAFDRVSNALLYRIEWSSSAGAGWSNSWASLNNISGAGIGAITASVPMLYRVVATFAPPDMALIPAGSFVMGNATNMFPSDGGSSELPQHTVYISAFYMDRREVTKAFWDEVKAFNGGNGYSYDFEGSGKATNHPVHTASWFDAIKWCNARSERQGLIPVYYEDPCFMTVYRTGEIVPYVKWSANGFRLPTEAEWEKAARGGATATRFPWTDYTNRISHAKANYYGLSSSFSYDLSLGYHPAFATNTSPVGYFAVNGYGLNDMAGNVWEWCWDWYSSSYYAISPGTDPRGPTDGTSRVHRGGSWRHRSDLARLSYRTSSNPSSGSDSVGLRCVWAP